MNNTALPPQKFIIHMQATTLSCVTLLKLYTSLFRKEIAVPRVTVTVRNLDCRLMIDRRSINKSQTNAAARNKAV